MFNFKKTLMLVTFISGLTTITKPVLADKEMPFYNDGFDTTGLLVENFDLRSPKSWKVENGKIHSTASMGSAVLKKSLDTDCSVSVDITPLAGKGKFIGVIFRGFKFLIRPDGFWYVYRLKAKSRASGGLINSKIIPKKVYKMKVISKKINKAWMFIWYIDGKKIAQFIEPGEIEDKTFFALFYYKMPAAFDNLAISKIVSDKISSNLLKNSSFEYLQEGIPLGWRPSDMNTVVGTYGTMENFWKTWKIDSSDAWQGKNSLYMENNSLTKANGAYSPRVGVAVKMPLVYSLYLKADKDNFPVTLVIWEWLGRWHFKKIKLSKQWKRYNFVLNAPAKNSVSVGIKFTAKGIVHMDAVQVEEGDKASPYLPSILDSGLQKKSNLTVKFPAPVNVPVLKTPPVLDGKISDDWKDVARVNNFLIAGKNIPREKTDAFIGCDKDNLYIGVKCYTATPEKIRALAQGHDDGKIWGDDVVEIFIDTN
ncbi:MAG: hypothetical protein D6707_01605, partial [Bacteroidetes bacterium]